jgi:hypothetical protein
MKTNRKNSASVRNTRTNNNTDRVTSRKNIHDSPEKEEVIENNNVVDNGGEVDWEPKKRISPGADEEG